MTSYIILALTAATSITAFASNKSICGRQDNRVSSFNQKIGRISIGDKHLGCTVTMISETCGITAGHCKKVFEYAEFNTPDSNSNGKTNASALVDKYYIDQSTVISKYDEKTLGEDWAVFNFKANSITGKFPGEVGGYYTVAFKTPQKGERLAITGYGLDKDDLEKNGTQQTHSGKANMVVPGMKYFGYSVDTMGGNSGSTIINSRDEVIGIHTNGGCSIFGGSNHGVVIRENRALRNAIKKCINRY